MKVKQSKNTFIRFFEDKGYLTNQLTKFDRVYNSTGADFLKQISRKPKEIDDIIGELKTLYGDSISEDDLKNEFLEFINDLAKSKFLIIGESEKELNEKDIDFSYSLDNPKTLASNFTQETKEIVEESTQNMMMEATLRKPRLNGIQFELTGRCNERCIHCYLNNEKKDEGVDLPLNKILEIIDEFSLNQGLQVTLSGGEMLLHPHIIEIIRYCREKDLMITLLSNMMALTDTIVNVIKEVNISGVQVSLYSMDPGIHDYITSVPGSFDRTKNAIEKLVAADIPVTIACPIMKANFTSYREVLEYAKSLKCKCNTDYIMMAQSDLDTSNLSQRLSVDETEILMRDILQFNIDYKFQIQNVLPPSEERKFDKERYKKMPLCGAGINDCCIGQNGDVFLCPGWQAKPLGNVYEKSLMDIWNNSEVAKEIRAVTEGDFPQCLDCEARDYCARCLVRNFNESGGDMFKINEHFCKVAFLNKRLVEEYNSRETMKN